MRSDRGFAAPDASFQLRLDVESQLAAIRHITMAEGPRASPGTWSAPPADATGADGSEPSGAAGATAKKTQGAAASAGALPAHTSSAAAGGADSAVHTGGSAGARLASAEGQDKEAGGESGGEGGAEGRAKGGERLSAPGRARGAGGGGKQPQVEKTQIHTFSPGVSGRQRSRQTFYREHILLRTRSIENTFYREYILCVWTTTEQADIL